MHRRDLISTSTWQMTEPVQLKSHFRHPLTSSHVFNDTLGCIQDNFISQSCHDDALEYMGWSYLLHCWQKRWVCPATITFPAFEWFSQTLCRRWYCLAVLRSALQPSAWHMGTWDPGEPARCLFPSRPAAVSSVEKYVLTPRFKPIRACPSLVCEK